MGQTALFGDEEDPCPTMPVGKFRGNTLGAVPSDYLRWAAVSMNSLSKQMKQAVREELDRRDSNHPRSPVFNTPITGQGLTGSIERSNQTLDGLTSRIQDLRSVLATGAWAEDEPIDLPLVASITGAAGAAFAHLDPENIAQKAERLREQKRTST